MEGIEHVNPDRDEQAADPLAGTEVLDTRGVPIGTIVRTYPRDAQDPEFAKLDTGPGPTVVPVEGARGGGDAIVVPATAEQIRDAPFVDAGRDLDPADVAALRDYYRDLHEGSDLESEADVAPLPPRGQEKVIPSEGPDDRPQTR